MASHCVIQFHRKRSHAISSWFHLMFPGKNYYKTVTWVVFMDRFSTERANKISMTGNHLNLRNSFIIEKFTLHIRCILCYFALFKSLSRYLVSHLWACCDSLKWSKNEVVSSLIDWLIYLLTYLFFSHSSTWTEFFCFCSASPVVVL